MIASFFYASSGVIASSDCVIYNYATSVNGSNDYILHNAASVVHAGSECFIYEARKNCKR